MSEDNKEDVTMKELLIEIKKLNETVAKLENQVNSNNTVLINHINFINGVFDTIKSPLLFIMNKINSVFLKEISDF